MTQQYIFTVGDGLFTCQKPSGELLSVDLRDSNPNNGYALRHKGVTYWVYAVESQSWDDVLARLLGPMPYYSLQINDTAIGVAREHTTDPVWSCKDNDDVPYPSIIVNAPVGVDVSEACI